MNLGKMTIDVEINGLEKLEKLKEEMEMMEENQSVFKAEMGSDMKFEGTKSDFLVFIEGIKNLHAFVSDMPKKRGF